MAHNQMQNQRMSARLGRYYSQKSLQPLNLSELQYLHHGSLTPPAQESTGFFHKCIESFKSHLPRVRQMAEDLFYEPVVEQEVYEYESAE